MEQFELRCFEFLKMGRKSGLFNAGSTLNMNAVMGCAIQYAYGDTVCDRENFVKVYESCRRASKLFINWVKEVKQ